MIRAIRVLTAISFAAALVVGLGSTAGANGQAVAGKMPCQTMGWQGGGDDRSCGF